MRIKSLKLIDHPPIKKFEVNELKNTIVIIGANGSGKTRLMQAIIDTMKGPAVVEMVLEATREEEVAQFGGKFLEINKGKAKNRVLEKYFQNRPSDEELYEGSLVRIDSNRTIRGLMIQKSDLHTEIPDQKERDDSLYLKDLPSRWNSLARDIYRQSLSRPSKIGEELLRSPNLNREEILENHPDPFEKYKRIFRDVLPGKLLLDLDLKNPGDFRYRDERNTELSFQSLSSGEQEIIKILFDVERKEIRHSIIIIDEPELHLHPSLVCRLIESLKKTGGRTNQLILFTHSSALISRCHSTDDVYFIDSSAGSENQARHLSTLEDEYYEVASLVGRDLGLFAVGKKIAFIEGKSTSLDRLVYQKVAEYASKDIHLIPTGSVSNIIALNALENQIRTAIFGVDLYMIRDRDGLDED